MKKIILLMLLCISLYANGKELNFLVKPYLQNVSESGITILWETNIPSNGYVKYGKAMPDRNVALLNLKSISINGVNLHSVNLKGLEIETEYFYQVVTYSGKDTLYSEINPFMTSIKKGKPVTFALFGDSQQEDDSTVWHSISNLALSERPNFGLIVGDLVDIGGNVDQWRYQFLGKANSFMKSINLFPVVGNHDIIYDDDAENYHKYMKHPGNKNFYTFSYGDIQFFILDSNRDMGPGTNQYDWLINELAKSKAKWKIVSHHHPPYSSDSNDFGDTKVAKPLDGDPNFNFVIPIYEKYNVDMVFYGHIHSYERTWPILNKKVNDKGVVYVQCGGAGGNNEKSGIIKRWFSAKVRSNHHFCMISIEDDKLYFSAIDLNGNIFDFYTINKGTKTVSNNNSNISLSAPVFKHKADKFIDKLDLKIINYNEKGKIRYTENGKIPDSNSAIYNKPLIINKTSLIKAKVFFNKNESKITEKLFIKTKGNEAIELSSVKKGLLYSYYEGKDWLKIPKFKNLKPKKKGVIDSVTIDKIKDVEDQFGITYSGYIKIAEDGVYDFYLLSDDGAKLYIDDELVADNDGSHSPRTRAGNVGLKKGYHKFHVEYFEDCEGEELKVFYKSENFSKKPIPSKVFFH